MAEVGSQTCVHTLAGKRIARSSVCEGQRPSLPAGHYNLQFEFPIAPTMAKSKKPSWIKDSLVRKKLPKGQALPASFDAFIEATPPIEVEWNDLESAGMEKTALKESLPFMRTGSGGVIALWYHTAEPAVIYLGSEGGKRVVAPTFDDFIKAIHAKKTGLGDLDESVEAFTVPGIKGKPKAVSAALQKKFETWSKQHSASRAPTQSAETETLRQKIFAAALELDSGLASDDPIRSCILKIEVYAPDDIEVHYRKKLAKKHALTQLAYELMPHIKKRKFEYSLFVYASGAVVIDGGRTLELRPSGDK
jgi:hypothetical protein